MPWRLLVAGAFREVLGRPAIDPGDDFFDLGGTSLSAVQLQDVLRRLTGTELSMTELFRDATARALARVLEERAHPASRQRRPADDLEEARRRGRTMRRARAARGGR